MKKCIKCGSIKVLDGREGYDYSCKDCSYNWHEDETYYLTPQEALKQLWDNTMHRDDMISRNVEEANNEDLICHNIISKALDKLTIQNEQLRALIEKYKYKISNELILKKYIIESLESIIKGVIK
jgi:hypothetical protein